MRRCSPSYHYILTLADETLRLKPEKFICKRRLTKVLHFSPPMITVWFILFIRTSPWRCTRALVPTFNSGLNAQCQAPESIFRCQNNAPLWRQGSQRWKPQRLQHADILLIFYPMAGLPYYYAENRSSAIQYTEHEHIWTSVPVGSLAFYDLWWLSISCLPYELKVWQKNPLLFLM